jgi:hypothetical protein
LSRAQKKRNSQSVWGENKKRDFLEDLGVDGTGTLKWNLKKIG